MPDQGNPDFFISRAGADAAFAGVIGHILEDASYRVVLQQWDFANRNFMERMHAALSSGARVIALLSNGYLASKYCEAEWLNALAGDPLNNDARLIVLRISECKPVGLLSGLAYWDLAPVRDRPDLLHDIVLTAVQPGRRKDGGPAALAQHLRDYLHAAAPCCMPKSGRRRASPAAPKSWTR
jgi:TIR domain